MTGKLQAMDLPELPGYVSVAQAAKILGMAKTSVFYNIYTTGILRQVFRVGDEKEEERPFILLLEADVKRVAEQRLAVPAPTYEGLLAEWNQRVKGWGASSGWDKFRISEKGVPRRELVQDYLKDHPEDTRPVKV